MLCVDGGKQASEPSCTLVKDLNRAGQQPLVGAEALACARSLARTHADERTNQERTTNASKSVGVP